MSVYTYVKKLQTSNKEVFNKIKVIRTATKGLKQVADLQRNALTSLIHFVQLYDKVN